MVRVGLGSGLLTALTGGTGTGSGSISGSAASLSECKPQAQPAVSSLKASGAASVASPKAGPALAPRSMPATTFRAKEEGSSLWKSVLTSPNNGCSSTAANAPGGGGRRNSAPTRMCEPQRVHSLDAITTTLRARRSSAIGTSNGGGVPRLPSIGAVVISPNSRRASTSSTATTRSGRSGGGGTTAAAAITTTTTAGSHWKMGEDSASESDSDSEGDADFVMGRRALTDSNVENMMKDRSSTKRLLTSEDIDAEFEKALDSIDAPKMKYEQAVVEDYLEKPVKQSYADRITDMTTKFDQLKSSSVPGQVFQFALSDMEGEEFERTEEQQLARRRAAEEQHRLEQRMCEEENKVRATWKAEHLKKRGEGSAAAEELGSSSASTSPPQVPVSVTPSLVGAPSLPPGPSTVREAQDAAASAVPPQATSSFKRPAASASNSFNSEGSAGSGEPRRDSGAERRSKRSDSSFGRGVKRMSTRLSSFKSSVAQQLGLKDESPSTSTAAAVVAAAAAALKS